jgi:hypothetical protein
MSSQVVVSEDLKLGAFVAVESLSGRPHRSFCGLRGTVAVGDQGQVVEVFKRSESVRKDDYRVICTNDAGELVWEANFLADELRPLKDAPRQATK